MKYLVTLLILIGCTSEPSFKYGTMVSNGICIGIYTKDHSDNRMYLEQVVCDISESRFAWNAGMRVNRDKFRIASRMEVRLHHKLWAQAHPTNKKD